MTVGHILEIYSIVNVGQCNNLQYYDYLRDILEIYSIMTMWVIL